MCHQRLRARRSRIYSAWIVTSSAVGPAAVGDQEFVARDSAIAIATRCRIPPESWCGYCASLCSGAGIPTAAEQFDAAFGGGGIVKFEMLLQRLDQLGAHQ